MLNKKSLFLTTCLVIFFITGCGYKQYDVPKLQEKGLPSDEIMAQFHVDKNWWTHYNDKQLNALLDIALTNNIDILDAISTLQRAFISLRVDEGNFIPSATSSLGISNTRNTGSHDSLLPDSQGSLSIGLSLDLSFWKNLPMLDASKWAARASAEALESVRLSIAYGLIDAYYSLMYYHQIHSLTLENISFLEEVLKTTEYQESLGSVDGLEPLTAKQSLNSAYETLILSEVNINDTLVLIRNYLNISPNDELSIRPVSIMRIASVTPDLDIPLETLSLRPDIRQAEFLAQAAFYQLKSAQRAWIPSISIASTLSSSGEVHGGNSLSTPFLSSNSVNLAGFVNVTLPFLSWWNIKWTVKEYENYMEVSLNDFTATINQALNEIQSIYFSYEKEKRLFALAREKTGIDRGIFQYRKILYDEGRDDIKNWLEANTNMNNSRENVLLAKLRIIRKENSLYQAMGGRILQIEDAILEEKEAAKYDEFINYDVLRRHSFSNNSHASSVPQDTDTSQVVRTNIQNRSPIGQDKEEEEKRARARATQKIDGTFSRF